MKHESRHLKKGYTTMVVVLVILFLGLSIIFAVTDPVARESRVVRELLGSKISFALASAGEEDVVFRIKNAMNYNDEEVLEIGGRYATSTVTNNIETGTKDVLTEGRVTNYIRKRNISLIKGEGNSFHYAVQIGRGGIRMENSSSVLGNIYSSGEVFAENDNLVEGSVISAGADGLVDGVHATSSVYSHVIQNATIEGDAYYQEIHDSTVYGDIYPDSEDQPEQDFPISDEKIDEWKQVAQDGGVISSPCPYEVEEDVTLGPVKIECDLEIDGGAQVTLAGMVWVVGDISIKNNSGVYLDESLGSESVALIADNPNNRIDSSIIELRNSTTFYNSGTNGSYLFMISGNRDAENGGTNDAISLRNSGQGDVILYSNHGMVHIRNNSELRSVTGYKVRIRNDAQLIYDDGLENTIFDTGPGGAWNIVSTSEVE